MSFVQTLNNEASSIGSTTFQMFQRSRDTSTDINPERREGMRSQIKGRVTEELRASNDPKGAIIRAHFPLIPEVEAKKEVKVNGSVLEVN